MSTSRAEFHALLASAKTGPFLDRALEEAATIDVMSGGRLELGIGAGWDKSEYDEVGIDFDPGPVRVSRLEEAIDIMTRLWEGEVVSFTGQHYRIDGLEGTPRPIQRRESRSAWIQTSSARYSAVTLRSGVLHQTSSMLYWMPLASGSPSSERFDSIGRWSWDGASASSEA